MLYTDITNAQKFAHMFSDRIRWSDNYGGWFIFNEERWSKADKGHIKNYAIQCHEKLLEELQNFTGDDDQLRQFSRHVKASGANNKLEAMLDCAKAYLTIDAEQFDNHDYLFNFKNGTLNFETRKLKDHNQNDFITKISNINFNKNAGCPLWLKFLDDIFLGREDIIDFMQRVIGYSMTASIKEHCLFILYGEGRNGKSIFINTIAKLMGDYWINCPSTTFVKKSNSSIPNDVAALKGARFVTAIESNQNVTLDEALIKQMTGGDKITARFLHREYFSFHPTFKIFIATNHKPNIRGTDTGIWRRIRMIPFDLKVTDAKDDKNLGEKLIEELPGIALWAAQGCIKWMNDGLKTPQTIIDATCEYKEEEDDLGQFIRDYCVKDAKAFIPVNEFKNRFKDVNSYYKSQKNIAEYMKRHGFDIGRPYVNGLQIRSWMGLKFLTAHQQTEYEGKEW